MVPDQHTRRIRERWQSLIQSFLVYGTTRNWSPRTIEAYAADLKEWSQHLTTAKRGLPEILERAAADLFLAALRARGNKPKSIARRINTLRSFGAFLKKSGALPTNPFDYLESPKVPKRIPKFAMSDEAKRIIEACATPKERVIITLFMRTGLRISELRNLRVEDRRDKQLRVVGKGDKEEMIELADSTDALLAGWSGSRTGWLFPGQNGKPISVSAIRALVYRVTTRAGRKLHPHALRHSFATIHVEHGTDLRTLQELMRHASIATTGHYSHIISRQKRKATEDFPI